MARSSVDIPVGVHGARRGAHVAGDSRQAVAGVGRRRCDVTGLAARFRRAAKSGRRAAAAAGGALHLRCEYILYSTLLFFYYHAATIGILQTDGFLQSGWHPYVRLAIWTYKLCVHAIVINKQNKFICAG